MSPGFSRRDLLHGLAAIPLGTPAPREIELSQSLLIGSGGDFTMPAGAAYVPAPEATRLLMVSIEGDAPTEWFDLAEDLATGGRMLVVGRELDWRPGDWVELRSEALIAGPNMQRGKRSRLRRIIRKLGPGRFELHKPVPESFLIGDRARSGKPKMVENVTVRGLRLDGSRRLIGMGVRISYAANVTIIDADIRGSKRPFGPDDADVSGIKVLNSVGVSVIRPRLAQLGWYGVGIMAAAEEVTVTGGSAFDVRHGVSIVWTNGYGEAADITIRGMQAERTALSGFDTHDTGQRVVFEECRSSRAGDNGFQFRAIGVLGLKCVAVGAKNDGFCTRAGADNCRIEHCRSEGNMRRGASLRSMVSVSDTDFLRNRTGGCAILGGEIRGGRFERNGGFAIDCGGDGDGRQSPLLIDGVHAPCDADQHSFLMVRRSLGRSLDHVTVRDANAPGYPSRARITSA